VKRLIPLALALLALAGLAVALVGCAAEDKAAAERARAEQAAAQAQAGILRAEAEAYTERQQADSEAAAERSAIRQAERDAAHERTMDNLPYVLAFGGGILILALAMLMFWDFRGQRQQAVVDPGLLFYLDRLRLESAGRDRELWHAIGELSRRELASGNGGGEVIIYPDKR